MVYMLLCTGFVAGITLYCLYNNSRPNSKKTEIPIDMLKNALLSYALMKLKNDDIDDISLEYKNFDGTKLPMFSGYNVENACFSYIIDKEKFRKDFFYTPAMEEKLNAIDKYLDKNLGTNEQVMKLFQDFVRRDGMPSESTSTS